MLNKYSVGYRFMPTDEVLLWYLSLKIAGGDIPDYTINKIEENIYARHPRDFDWSHVSYLEDNERYFFSKRVQVSKTGQGKKVKRELEILEGADGGFWKASSKENKIFNSKSEIIGYVRLLKFHEYKNKNRIRKEAQPADWIMHEYRLNSNIFQEWVLCRIKTKRPQQLQPNENPTFSSLLEHFLVNQDNDHHHHHEFSPQQVEDPVSSLEDIPVCRDSSGGNVNKDQPYADHQQPEKYNYTEQEEDYDSVYDKIDWLS